MTNNISPELLMQLYGQQYRAPSSGSGWTPESAYGPTDAQRNFTAGNGDTWHTDYNQSGSVEQGGINYTPSGLLRDVKQGKSGVGDQQEIYDTYGQYVATGQIPPDTSFQDFLMMAAMVAGPFAAGMSPGINAAMSFGTNPVMGGMGGGAAGAAGGMSAAAGGGSGVSGPGMAGWGSDLGMAGTAGTVGLDGVAAGAGAGSVLSGAASAAGAGGGLLGKALGVGSTLLGGAAGAAGGDDEKKTTRDVPEWLKPYVTKNLEYAGGLLDKQMAPGYLQGFDDMRNVGQGLLKTPQQGNGFSRFFPKG